jgi:hypothetical protein
MNNERMKLVDLARYMNGAMEFGRRGYSMAGTLTNLFGNRNPDISSEDMDHIYDAWMAGVCLDF